MEDAPPYSPTAASHERRLPNDYNLHMPVQYEDDSTTRPRATITSSSRHGPSLSLVPSRSPLFEAQDSILRHIATAPASVLHPLEQPPPDYAPVDALASSFRLDRSLIYATKTSNTPRYQLLQEFTRSGMPRKLSIRRLLPSETRAGSLPSTLLSLSTPRLRYDEEGTMYTITTYEMRGHRCSTLAGSTKLETGTSWLGTKWTKIWLSTKNARRDSLNPENEARISKYGYHANEEWDKRLLFGVKRGIWKDMDGRMVAVEEKERELEVLGEISGARRDLLISCWVMRMWLEEGLRWEGDVKGW